MENIRKLYMNVYGGTLKKIIEDINDQIDDSYDDDDFDESQRTFLTESIKIAIEIYKDYYIVTDEIKKLAKKYLN